MATKNIIEKFILNGVELTLPDGGGGGVDIEAVNALIDGKLGNYDTMFKLESGLYKILNDLDSEDNLGLESGETRADIVASATNMSKISHSRAVMTRVASSSYALGLVLNSNSATKEISEDWNSIFIVANNEDSAISYLNSANGQSYYSSLQIVRDAFEDKMLGLAMIVNDSAFENTSLKSQSVLDGMTDEIKDRINSMDADDLLPAIFYWTGLSGYSTFAELAESDSAMEIVQSDTESMLIISQNEEAMEYFGRHPGPNTVAYFPLVDDATDTVNGITLTNSGTKDATIGRTFNTTVDYSNVTKIKESNFISVWIRINSGLYGTSCCTQLFDVGERPISYCTSHSEGQFRNAVHCNDTSNNRPYINTGMEQGTRYLYCAGYENGKAYYWKNGVKQVISNNCKSTGGLGELIRVLGAGVNITLSDLRLENQLPSDEDTVKYFEKTKKNYGYT